MDELKACPFCGALAGVETIKRRKAFSKLRYPYNTHFFYVRCKWCRVSTAVYETAAGAIEAWNRRVGNV